MNEEKFDKLWINGFVIFDTCALDFISRCEFQYAKKIMDILLFCKDRILIPQHVVKEMQPYFDMNKIQKNVDTILLELEGELKDIYNDTKMEQKMKRKKVKSRVSKKINLLKKYAFQVYGNMLERLLKEYTKQNKIEFPSISACLELANSEIDSLSKSKTVNSFLQMILEKTLPEFSEEEREEVLRDVRERISNQLPPGVGDNEKKVNCEGDIIIWNEIKKCIRDRGRLQYLFITYDAKKKNNWFGRNLEELHPLLEEEIQKSFSYNALDITTLCGFISFCKPYVNQDIEELCKYLINKNIFITTELEEYFYNEGSQSLIDGISEYIRDNYMGDWALPYDLDIEIDSLEYDIDSLNDKIVVTFDFEVYGDADTCYHCDSEDNIFDAEYEASGTAKANIPIQKGKYTEIFSLKYNDMMLFVTEMDIVTTDPLNGNYEDNYYEEHDDYEDNYYEECDDYEDDNWLDE